MSRTSTSIEQAREPRTRRAGGRAASRRALAIALAVLAATVAAAAEDLPRTPAPDGARVYFIDLEDGAVVSSPLVVRFGLEGMGVAPAGVSQPHTGHHHLLIDADLSDSSQPVPSDEHHRHFGGGQTEVSVELSPGEHTLQLVLGDHLHIPHQPPVVSQRITVTVK
jgi:hypothetical protein